MFDALRGSGAAVGCGAVCGDDEERSALVVGFDDGGEEFRRSCARGGGDGDGAPGGLDAAEGEEGSGTFIEVRPRFEFGALGEGLQDGGVARAGAADPFADACKAASSDEWTHGFDSYRSMVAGCPERGKDNSCCGGSPVSSSRPGGSRFGRLYAKRGNQGVFPCFCVWIECI